MEYGVICGHFGTSLVFLFLLLHARCVSSQAGFQWATGPWGPCEHTHCGYGGKQYREVWCQGLNHQAVHYSHCTYFEKPSEVQECFKSCDTVISEKSYREREPWSQENDVVWSVSPWSTCRIPSGSSECGKYRGIQKRTVTCELSVSRIKQSDVLCELRQPKPAMTQPCEMLCKQDCVVTPYSSWTQCDRSCRIPNRTRTRRIVVPPRHGGKHCPKFSEMIPCDNCSETYIYSLEPWEPCQPFEKTFGESVKTHPLIGYQKRVINCLTSKGTLTSFKFCTEKVSAPLLHRHQSCVIPQDCIVSDWSQIQPYNNSCRDGSVIRSGYIFRTRKVLQLPLGDGNPCPDKLHEIIKLEGEDINNLKPCKRTTWVESPWSPCEHVPGYSHCGTGIQSRKVFCAEVEDGRQRPVSEKQCDPSTRPNISQRCHLECNWHCTVSQWTSWSQCEDKSCDDNGKKRQTLDISGKRYRTRDILTLPGPGGNPCPHLSETQSCVPKPCFKWNITLGDCTPTLIGGCGIGHRTRYSVCVNRKGERVSEGLCWEYKYHVDNYVDCYVPCWNDCVLSEWGEWSECPEPCTGGINIPSYRTRERSSLAFGGKDGQPCTPKLQEKEACPARVECAKYVWKHGDWGPCLFDSPSPTCGRGLQQRDVQCYNHLGQTVIERRCEDRVKPKQSQTCNIACPVDCVVSEWSEWSNCGVECRDVTARQILPKQQRRLFVLQYPQGAGAPCPNSFMEERQCLHLPICEQYEWETSSWSDCILPPIVPYCGNGLRARNTTCRHGNGTELEVNTCLQMIGAMPSMMEKCYVPCAKECQISDWSPWERCVGGCNGYRFRMRKLMGESRFQPQCKRKYVLDEREKCRCSQLSPMVIGNWSDCVLDKKEPVRERFAQMSLKSFLHREVNESAGGNPNEQAYCGTGKQFKAYACQNDKHDMESADKCFNAEYKEEVCIVPCPVDCEMTEWSEWSQCIVTCGSGMQLRSRSIATHPADGGRKCPSLDETQKETQSRVCRIPCEYHIWDVGEWGSCQPRTGTGCGHGTRTRRVRCKKIGGAQGMGMYSDESLCLHTDRPLDSQVCLLPCPGDCVFSEWTAWSPCTQPCNGRQNQSRTRKLLRKQSNYHAQTPNNCSHMKEERQCIRGNNCIEYSWQLSDWTSCLVNGGYDECGVGHKERYAWCRDETGKPVDTVYCNQVLGEVTESLVVSCEIPCDNDCLLSDWSDWTPCTTTCGLGQTQRNRTILENPIGNGRQCPPQKELRQAKPCFKKGCYRWLVSDWSACEVQPGVCGQSVQRRNVSCVGEDGLQVDTDKCPQDVEKLVMKTVRMCTVPCPGECILSEWSLWSDCHIRCHDFILGSLHNVGVKVRSRAILAQPRQENSPCSDVLWEEAPCHAQRCYNFSWKKTLWNRHGDRQVWCQRSDGFNVTGGCDSSVVLPLQRRCSPPCRAPKSDCVDTNVCKCRGDLVPLISFNGTLKACVMDTNESTTDLTTSLTVPAAGASNIWMYAVIAVGTIFIISVAAALYNMCELFRTGPRPRRRGAKTSQNDLKSSQNINEKNAEMDALYKQCNQSTNDLNKDVDKNPDTLANVCLLHGVPNDIPVRKTCRHGSHKFYRCLLCSKHHECSENELNHANLTNETSEDFIRSACLSTRDLDLDIPSPVVYSNIGEMQFHSSLLDELDKHNVAGHLSERWNEDNSVVSKSDRDSYACSLNTTMSFGHDTSKSTDSRLFVEDIRRDPTLFKVHSQDSNEESLLALYALPHKSQVAVHSPEDNCVMMRERGTEPSGHLWNRDFRSPRIVAYTKERNDPNIQSFEVRDPPNLSACFPPPPPPPIPFRDLGRTSPLSSSERLETHSLSAGNICDTGKMLKKGGSLQGRPFWSHTMKNDRTHPLDKRGTQSLRAIPILKVNGEMTSDKKETTV